LIKTTVGVEMALASSKPAKFIPFDAIFTGISSPATLKNAIPELFALLNIQDPTNPDATDNKTTVIHETFFFITFKYSKF
jgi:hypothetical protein